ncbi:MAG: TSUP family transporter [Ilumatobacteraceae bacterium]
MALFSPHHQRADVDRHTEVFAGAVAAPPAPDPRRDRVSGVELAVVAGAVFVAALVQVLSGFGFAAVGADDDPRRRREGSGGDQHLMGMSMSSWQAWHGGPTDRAVARHMVIGAYLGMPFGLVVYLTVDDHVLRFLLGIAVLVAVVLLAIRLDLRHAGTRLDSGAGFVSGVLNTSLSTNGPPLVFALQARHLGPDAFRATINTVFAFSNIFGSPCSSRRVGSPDGIVAAAIAIPSLLVGQLTGLPLRRHVAGERFRTLVLLLLTAAALSAIISAVG